MRTKTARTASLSFLLALAGGLSASCGGDGDGSAKESAAVPAGAATPGSPKAPGAKGGKGEADAKPAKGGKGEASALLAYQTGQQLLLKGDPAKAQSEFQRATELDANMSEAFYELGRLQVHLSSQNVGSQARDLTILDQGIAALERARELEPANDQYWFWVGRAYFLKNDSANALANLGKAVELNPKHGGAWKALGIAQVDAAETEKAKTSFENSIAAEPDDAGAHFQLGQVQEVLGDLPAARASYEKSIALDPTEPEVFGRLTQVCGKLGDPEGEARARAGMDAWTEYAKKLDRRRRAVNQAPNDAQAVCRLGEMYFEVGKWEEALGWFMKSIHINPKDPLTHVYCGVTRRHMKDYVNAANHLKEAEFLDPDNLDPKLELLRLYADTKDDASAKELIAKVEAEAAGESLWFLAEVCQETGRTEDATRLFEKAKALGVTSSPDAQAAPAEGQ